MNMMTKDSIRVSGLREAYLALIENTLMHTLWHETFRTEVVNPREWRKRFAMAPFVHLLKPFGIQMVRLRPVDDRAREEARTWPQFADTMIGRKRLDHLRRSIGTVLAERIPGDFIETGVWR